MAVSLITQEHIDNFSKKLGEIVDAEIGKGNSIAETFMGWPFKESIFIGLKLPFLTIIILTVSIIGMLTILSHGKLNTSRNRPSICLSAVLRNLSSVSLLLLALSPSSSPQSDASLSVDCVGD